MKVEELRRIAESMVKCPLMGCLDDGTVRRTIRRSVRDLQVSAVVSVEVFVDESEKCPSDTVDGHFNGLSGGLSGGLSTDVSVRCVRRCFRRVRRCVRRTEPSSKENSDCQLLASLLLTIEAVYRCYRTSAVRWHHTDISRPIKVML